MQRYDHAVETQSGSGILIDEELVKTREKELDRWLELKT
jgi:hypothetical protein